MWVCVDTTPGETAVEDHDPTPVSHGEEFVRRRTRT